MAVPLHSCLCDLHRNANVVVQARGGVIGKKSVLAMAWHFLVRNSSPSRILKDARALIIEAGSKSQSPAIWSGHGEA